MRSSNRDLELQEAEHTEPSYWTEAAEKGQPTFWLQRSENFHVERQIFLGIFPDRLHQLPRLYQHLVAVVVERRILEQHPCRALAFFQARGQGSQIIYRLLQLVGEFLIARHLAYRAFARIDVVGHLANVRNRLVRVVIQLGIFEQFAGRTFSLLQLVNQQVHFVDGGDHLLIRLVARKQWTDRALSTLDIVNQSLELSHRRVEPVVQGRIVNDFPDRTLTAFDKCQNAIHPLQQRVHVLQRALAGAHHVLDIRLVAGLQRISVYCLRTLRPRTINIHIGFAKYPRGTQHRH